MGHMRRLMMTGVVVGLVGIAGIAYGPQNAFPAAVAPSTRTATATVVFRNAITATAAQRLVEWQPTQEAEKTCNHAKPPAMAQVILPDVAGMTSVEAHCALIRAGVSAPIELRGYSGRPADAVRVSPERIAGVAFFLETGEAHRYREYERVASGTQVSPDTRLILLKYTPNG